MAVPLLTVVLVCWSAEGGIFEMMATDLYSTIYTMYYIYDAGHGSKGSGVWYLWDSSDI